MIKSLNANKPMKTIDYYDSANQLPHALREIKDAFRYRYLILQLIRRDILTRYKRSFLGVTWTMLNPLGMMIVLTIVFSRLFGSSPTYPVYILSGLMAWNFFSKSTSAAMNSMVWGGSLLKRIYMPRTSFSLASIGTEMVNLLLSLIPLAVVMLITGAPFNTSLFYLPICIFLLACFSLGIALLFSSLSVFFPDVVEMYQIILTAWMYLTPIIYTISIFPERYRPLLLLNPMTFLVELFHICIIEGRFPAWGEVWPAAAWSFGILIVGWLFFTKQSDEFAYRV
jgi:ABC-type polysaccharide/polyol phosphate export permease